MHRRFDSILSDFNWVASQPIRLLSNIVSFDTRTKMHEALRLAANDIEAPITQRSMFFIKSLRSAAAMNSAGTPRCPVRPACAPARRTCPCPRPAGSRSAAAPAGIVLHQGALDVFDPNLVIGLYARVGVGLVDRVHLISAEFAPAAYRIDRVADGRIDVGVAGRQYPEPTVTVAPRFLISNTKLWSLTRLTIFSAQVSTCARCRARASPAIPLPPNLPHRSVAVSCGRSSSASCAMKSSLARTPIVFWISRKRSGFM